MEKMSAADLRDLVVKRRDAAFTHVNGQLARDRRSAWDYYNGKNLNEYGDSGSGLSTVVSRDTMEAIESMLPSLLRPFVSGDEVVRFEPRGPEDEDGATQATQYINYLFTNHNDSFRVLYDTMKDGLLLRYGCVKVVVEEIEDKTIERYQGLDEIQLSAVANDPTMEVVDNEITQNPDGSFSLSVEKTEKTMMFRVIVVPPDRFLFESYLASLDDATFLGHHDLKPVGDLIAMGLDPAKCRKLKPGTPASLGDWGKDGNTTVYEEDDDEQLSDDDPARRVWVDDCYIRCAYDGSDDLTWRHVIIGGNDNLVLLDEEADDHPFEGWTPVPQPNKLIGDSIWDQTKDIQKNKTAIKREGLNALYLANRPQRAVVVDQVNTDDLLSPTVGGIVRVKREGSIEAIPSGGDGVMQQALAMLEALDSEREARTGVTRYNQGMDANSLNHTATGVQIISNASQQRQELIARQYAESLLTGVFKKMLKNVSRYQDKAQVIRLNGKWVEMDPTEWKTGYDMSISVGLGTGDKQQQAAQLTNLMQIQQQIAEGQGGLNGPLVTWKNVGEAAKKYVEAIGLKGADRFIGDGDDQAQRPQGPSSEQMQAQAEQQQAQQQQAMEAQQKQAEMQADQQNKEADRQADMMKNDADLAQKHATAIEVARINANSSETVAKINAEKEITIAGLQTPPNITPDDIADGIEEVGNRLMDSDTMAPEGA